MRPHLILHMDDQPDALELMRIALEGGAYQVVSASDGATALRLAEEMRPDLILVDFNLPVISGIELLAQLKSVSGVAGIPVVMLRCTGLDWEELYQRAIDLGAYGVYHTPTMRVNDILEAVSDALNIG